MNQQITSTTPGNNGESTPHDLFALTDEQILEIEPDVAPVEQPLLVVPTTQASAANADSAATPNGATPRSETETNGHTAQPGMAVPQEPPPWLAAQMKDPWTGEEARELWNGVQQARSEAAAYRAAFANPEDARALKELYPGGVTEARAAAERARVLADIDRAYFGVAGGTPEQTSAARGELAQRMLGEDPAAFREMVFAGLRALEEARVPAGHQAAELQQQRRDAGQTPGIPAGASAGPIPAAAASGPVSSVGAQHAAPLHGSASANEAHLAAYAAFEKTANDDLERSVGASIERTLQQTLPNVGRISQDASSRAGQAPPLQARLSAAIRQDVEAALKSDRQLGEQVAQILSGRRLDGETRAQVVRLIGERAQQLVPIAAKRVLSDWTQTTLAAHRGNAARADAASSRREVAPASTDSRVTSFQAETSTNSRRDPSRGTNHSLSRTDHRRVDYRKFSDEQILEL